MIKVLDKIISPKNLSSLKEKNKGKKIGLCSGCFDIFHSGHSFFFESCKSFCDILVVSVGSDSVIRELKGNGRPVNSENNRIYLVASINNVDYAVLGAEVKDMKAGKVDFYDIMKNLRPDIFIINNDDSAIKEKSELCKKLNVELKIAERIVPEFLKSTSSTNIIKNIQRHI